jgi:SH3-like domain-containing protein
MEGLIAAIVGLAILAGLLALTGLSLTAAGLVLGIGIDGLVQRLGLDSAILGWFLFGALFGTAVALTQLGRRYRASSLGLLGWVSVAGLAVAGVVGFKGAVEPASVMAGVGARPGPAAAGRVMVVAADNVNLRNGPSSSAAVITRVVRGQGVEVYGAAAEWRRVGLPVGGPNVFGWIHGRYLLEERSMPGESETTAPNPTMQGGGVTTSLPARDPPAATEVVGEGLPASSREEPLAAVPDQPIAAPASSAATEPPSPEMPAPSPVPGLTTSTPDDVVKGVWKGQVRQPGAPDYPMTLTITALQAGATAGTVLYPSLRCDGEMVFRSSDGETFRFTERIRRGSCVDNGTVTIVLGTDGTASWRWVDGQGTASAILHRQ